MVFAENPTEDTNPWETLSEEIKKDLEQKKRELQEISMLIAMAVAEAAYDKKLAAASKPIDMKAFIQSHMWEPVYVDYV